VRERAVALVAEYDRWIRLVMHDLLVQDGYRVEEASNGFSALRLAKRERLALVLLDLVLPDQSGLSVLAELRAATATAHVPLIVFCGQPHELRSAVTQADAVIAKPFAVDTLPAAVCDSRGRRRRRTYGGWRANHQDLVRDLHLAMGKYWSKRSDMDPLCHR
jgi:DNA-binding response OmpR family regulator